MNGNLMNSSVPDERNHEELKPRMSVAEQALLASFLRQSRRYFEFGSGGSTVFACKFVSESVISVDSDKRWHEKVLNSCSNSPIKPELRYVDIGKTGEWGYPSDNGSIHRWPSYHSQVWDEKARSSDFFFVDGRFRIATFCQSVINSQQQSLIAFHDFNSRPEYHVVREIAIEIARAEDLSIFLPRFGSIDVAYNILVRNIVNPN